MSILYLLGPRRGASNLSAMSDPGKPKAGIIDVCFVVDTTGSMDVYLEKTKDSVKLLVKQIREKTKANDISVRFGFVIIFINNLIGCLS